MTEPLYSLSRKEGWRRYVEAPARERPGQLSPRQLKRLGGAAREEYDEARHDWHANFGILRTPQLAAVHDELELIVSAGRQDPDRVRGAAVIDALPGLGKTTAANSFARGFDRAQIRRHGPLTGEGHERIPVFRVGLTSNTTLRTLNRMICQFYGHPGVGRAGRGLFAEGLTGQNAALAQTGRRWTRLELPPFEIVSEQGRRDWQGLLKATERQLVLACARPGMLTQLADYLFERTSGHIGSFITLITRGCVTAIRSGQENLTAALLDRVRIDEASEQARRQLAAAFTAGRLSAAPARRGRPRAAAS